MYTYGVQVCKHVQFSPMALEVCLAIASNFCDQHAIKTGNSIGTIGMQASIIKAYRRRSQVSAFIALKKKQKKIQLDTVQYLRTVHIHVYVF